jgi:hypothetical protein
MYLYWFTFDNPYQRRRGRNRTELETRLLKEQLVFFFSSFNAGVGGLLRYHPPEDQLATVLYSGPPLALYSDFNENINVIVDINGLCAIQGNTSGWSDPINLCTAAGVSSSELFGDASAMIWHNDDMEHVFGIYGAGAEDNIGLVKELWSYFNTSTWAAHNVLHEVKSVVGSSPDSPLAPPASVESVLAAFDDGAKNVAYLDVNGAVYLCSHPLKGEWTTSYLSEIAQAPATASGSAPIISGP